MTVGLCHHQVDVDGKTDAYYYCINALNQAVQVQSYAEYPEFKKNFHQKEGDDA